MFWNRRLAPLVIGVLVSSFAAGVSGAEGELNLLTWEGYADPSFVKPFEKETGCRVSATYVGTNDEFVAKVMGGGAAYDLVSPSNDTTKRLIDAGTIEPVDMTKVPGVKDFFPIFRSPPWLTKNGKVDRTALSLPNGDHVSARGEPTVATARALPATASELTRRITEIAAGILDIVNLSPDAEFMSLGATSVDLIRLATALEKEFGYRPSIDHFVSFSRVDLLANYYEQAVPHAPQQSLSSSSVDPPAPCSQYRSSPLLIDPRDRERFRRSEPSNC